MILITGANGQLGYDFQKLLNEINEEYIATDVQDLDITDINKVRNFVKDKNIKLIINCAAYNNVDKAEDESELCKKIKYLCSTGFSYYSKRNRSRTFTYSTDFVFDGGKRSIYGRR